MKLTFRSIVGSFRLARSRAIAEGANSVTPWTATGEQATAAVQAQVRDGAHKAETNALEIERELRDVLADGKVTPAELARLKRLPPRAHGVAETCHDVGEVAR